MNKLIFLLTLVSFSLFAQDATAPVTMINKVMTINDLQSKKKLVLDFNGKSVKLEGELEPAKAYDIFNLTVGSEVNSLRAAIDSLIIVNNYLESRLRGR